MAHRCSRIGFAALALFFAGGARLFAVDAAPKTDVPDPIATAKRELETIKASGAGTPDGKVAIPTTSLPTFEAKDERKPSGLPTIATRKLDERDELKAGGRSPNWLVDAMTEKQPRTDQDASTDARLLGRRGASREDRWEAANPPRKGEAPRTEEKDGLKDLTPDRVPNPLSGYMATWMTPRDFGLLYPKKTNEPADSLSTPFSSPGRGNADAPGLALLGDPLASPSAPVAGVSISTPQPNPYIAELAPSPGPSAVALQPPLESAKTQPAMGETGAVDSAAAISSPSSSPSAPPSGDDAKYFKQLDRF